MSHTPTLPNLSIYPVENCKKNEEIMMREASCEGEKESKEALVMRIELLIGEDISPASSSLFPYYDDRSNSESDKCEYC